MILCTFVEHGLKGVSWSPQGNIKILCQAVQVLAHVHELVWNQSRGLVT